MAVAILLVAVAVVLDDCGELCIAIVRWDDSAEKSNYLGAAERSSFRNDASAVASLSQRASNSSTDGKLVPIWQVSAALLSSRSPIESTDDDDDDDADRQTTQSRCFRQGLRTGTCVQYVLR